MAALPIKNNAPRPSSRRVSTVLTICTLQDGCCFSTPHPQHRRRWRKLASLVGCFVGFYVLGLALVSTTFTFRDWTTTHSMKSSSMPAQATLNFFGDPSSFFESASNNNSKKKNKNKDTTLRDQQSKEVRAPRQDAVDLDHSNSIKKPSSSFMDSKTTTINTSTSIMAVGPSSQISKENIPQALPPTTPVKHSGDDLDQSNKRKSNDKESATTPKIAIPPTSTNNTLPSWEEFQKVQQILQQQWNRFTLPLVAVLEDNPIQNRKPLPRRHPNTALSTIVYDQHIPTCRHIPNDWPVMHPTSLDWKYGSNVATTENKQQQQQSLYPDRILEYAKDACPVDADPFLPWIHDVFVEANDDDDNDSHKLKFVAHNKRRCHSHPKYFGNDIQNLEPQVSLMQSIPIQKLDFQNRTTTNNNIHNNSKFLDSLWKELPSEWTDVNHSNQRSTNEHWYRLVPLEEADEPQTRFLCQFFTLRPTGNERELEKVILKETWSQYFYNREHANYQNRRGSVGGAPPLLNRPKDSKDFFGIRNDKVLNAILDFYCPIPEAIRQEQDKMMADDVPRFYMDLVPVRTPPREDVTGYAPDLLHVTKFDPLQEWGQKHVLPPVSQSGRWANIPLCPTTIHDPSNRNKKMETAEAHGSTITDTLGNKTSRKANGLHSSESVPLITTEKPRYLTGCVWASAVFSERGKTAWDTSTRDRLLEWLTYHLFIAGFDHIVVYDNTEAHTDKFSLKPITDLFGPDKVSWIPWKHRICNNNGYGHPDAGERSSQYAAESSCRLRFGPTTEWMSFFDTDEYLVPSGNWSSIREWLQNGTQDGTISEKSKILSFYETKALLNYRFTEEFVDDSVAGCRSTCSRCHCRQKRKNATYLEAFCEPFPFPREQKTKTKMKQIYQPSFVLNHFVHYTLVTKFIKTRPKLPRVVGYPQERRAKEFTEAYMVHTKSRSPDSMSNWPQACRPDSKLKCPIGFPYPFYQGQLAIDPTNRTNVTMGNHNLTHSDQGVLTNENLGVAHNCYELEKVQSDLAGRLHALLGPIRNQMEAVFELQS